MPRALRVLTWYELPDGTRVIACAACAGPDGAAPTGGSVRYDQSEWAERRRRAPRRSRTGASPGGGTTPAGRPTT